MQENGGQEVVQDLANLGVLRDVLIVLVHELIFSGGKVRQHLIIKVHVRFYHFAQSILLLNYNCSPFDLS